MHEALRGPPALVHRCFFEQYPAPVSYKMKSEGVVP